MLRGFQATTPLTKKLCVATLPIFNEISVARSRCSMTEVLRLTTRWHMYVSQNLRPNAAQMRNLPVCWNERRRYVPQSNGQTVPHSKSWPLQKKSMANSPRQRTNVSERIMLPNLTMQPTLFERG